MMPPYPLEVLHAATKTLVGAGSGVRHLSKMGGDTVSRITPARRPWRDRFRSAELGSVFRYVKPTNGFAGPSWAPAVAFGLLLLTLAFRPAGLLGR